MAEAVVKNIIRIPTYGTYRLSFYAFMFCDHETCNDIEDFIKFYINYGPSPIYLHSYYIGFMDFDKGNKKAWGRFEITLPFQISQDIIVSS